MANKRESKPGFEVIESFSTQGLRQFQENLQDIQPSRGIGVLVDAFGGGEYGKSGATTIVESVMHFLKKEAGDSEATLPFIFRPYFSLSGNIAFNALIYANKNLMKRNQSLPIFGRAGASALTFLLDGSNLAIAQVGSLQSYLFRSGQLRQLTTSRNLAAYYGLGYGLETQTDGNLIRSQLVTPITALGLAHDFEPELVETQVHSGDLLFFSTAGIDLHEWILQWSDSPEKAQSVLVKTCVENAMGFVIRIL